MEKLLVGVIFSTVVEVEDVVVITAKFAVSVPFPVAVNSDCEDATLESVMLLVPDQLEKTFPVAGLAPM